MGVRGTCCLSCHPPCHHKAPRAATPTRCVRPLCRAGLLTGPPCVAPHASLASLAACHWSATSSAVWRVESPRRHGDTRRDTVARGGPRGTGHALPARHLDG